MRYIERTHAWYGALGFAPYRYACFADVPFSALRKPLAQARVALLSTAAPYRPDKGEQGAIAPRVFGVPTNRSQRHTQSVDAPGLLACCLADQVDAALLVPNCPVCHQTMALVARQLEAAGIASVVLGAAKDIVEQVGVPRLLFSDLPLGHAAGLPHDADSQDLTLELALRLLESAPAARCTLQSPLRWPGPAGWRDAYLNLARLSAQELAGARSEHQHSLAIARALRRP